jgi:hypothetical protein
LLWNPSIINFFLAAKTSITAKNDSKQLQDWKCKLCDFYNCLPPQDPTECNRCQHDKSLCAFHSGKTKKEDCDNIFCYSCRKHYKYADPNYDAPTILYNLTVRAVKMRLLSTGLNNLSPAEKRMKQRIENLADKDWSDPVVFDALDDILWDSFVRNDSTTPFHYLGEMLIVSEEIDKFLSQEEEAYARKEKRQEKNLLDIEKDPDTFEVKGSKKGTSYFVNLELEVCTCPGFKFRSNCKHIHMKKKPKSEK